ncbi:MAG: ferritin-like domain-containing protein [Vulcanimicrobiota bacterium]
MDTLSSQPGISEENTGNPIGLESETASAVATDLRRHQASLSVLFHQYQKHHWMVEGHVFRDLHHFFEEQYTAVLKALDAVAERVTMLGGMPASSPAALLEFSYLDHEPEQNYPLRAMLVHDLRAEQRMAMMLRQSIRATNELGDFGSETLLRGVLMGCEDRAHHLDHYLADSNFGHG